MRVTTKTPIRSYANARGPGKLFSCDLIDQSGEIRATAFNTECEKFHGALEIGQVHPSIDKNKPKHSPLGLLHRSSITQASQPSIQYLEE